MKIFFLRLFFFFSSCSLFASSYSDFFSDLSWGLSHLTPIKVHLTPSTVHHYRDLFVKKGSRTGFVVGDDIRESDDKLVRSHVAYIFWLDCQDVEEHTLETLTRKPKGYIVREELSEIWIRIAEEREVNEDRVYLLRESNFYESDIILQFIKMKDRVEALRKAFKMNLKSRRFPNPYHYPLKGLRKKMAKRAERKALRRLPLLPCSQ